MGLLHPFAPIVVCTISAFPPSIEAFALMQTSFRTQPAYLFANARLYAKNAPRNRLSKREDLLLPDYLITDSIDLDTSLRPTVSDLILSPRNIAPTALVSIGLLVAACNVAGLYDTSYYIFFQQVSIALGFLSATLDCKSASPPYAIDTTQGTSPNVRLGVVDDATVHAYSGIYTASASWLALRTSAFCPTSVQALDTVMAPLGILIFVLSLVFPALTLLDHYTDNVPQVQRLVSFVRQSEKQDALLVKLSDTELLRAKSLLGIGVVGCVYAPIAWTFFSLGQDWWMRVLDVYPGQSIMESSTSLYGVFATQASMLAHRGGKMGVALYVQIVPIFTILCFFLTILPCIAGLSWLGDKISFYEYYSL